jgi:hypothetical protein
VLSAGGTADDAPAVWAAGIVELQAAYLAAAGGDPGSVHISSIGGELALLVEHPGDIAAAALVVHNGRVYIITTTGSASADPAPGFEGFIAGFTFLD